MSTFAPASMVRRRLCWPSVTAASRSSNCSLNRAQTSIYATRMDRLPCKWHTCIYCIYYSTLHYITLSMCAAEHGQVEIVKYLLTQPDTDIFAKDNDGLTALAVAMEAGHRDLGVVLYANMSMSRGTSPYSSMRLRPSAGASRTSTPSGSIKSKGTTPPRSPMVPTPPIRSRRTSSNQ